MLSEDQCQARRELRRLQDEANALDTRRWELRRKAQTDVVRAELAAIAATLAELQAQAKGLAS